jgi:chitin disaccharide deacetylase
LKRRLIINADDFGLATGINDGILFCHRAGVVRSTSIMANGDAFLHAVALAREHPTLDVGCHLVLTGGQSVAGPGVALPGSTRELMASVIRRKIRLFEEISAQVERVLMAGLQITHLDTHKSVHLLPPVMEAVARVAAAYKVPWVRLPFDFGWNRRSAPLRTRAAYRAFGIVRWRLERTLATYHCRTTDHFTGLYMVGKFFGQDLQRLFAELPPGRTELMCHPGFCDNSLDAAPTHLRAGRRRELDALTAPATLAAAAQANVEIVSYRDINSEQALEKASS